MADHLELGICPADDLPRALATWRPDHVLSMSAACQSAPVIAHDSITILTFDDVTAARSAVTYGRKTYPRFGAIFADIVSIITTGRERHRRLLLVCTAGLGRSPTAALIVLAARGRRPEEACAIVHAAHPDASPNSWMLMLADEALRLPTSMRGAAASTFRPHRDERGALGARPGLITMPG